MDNTTNVSSTNNTLDNAANTNAANAYSSADIFPQLAEKIIKEQENIIGPVAYEQAAKVPGLYIDPQTHAITVNGNKKEILDKLVKQYELLFGRVSIEICKEAVRGIISQAPQDQIPQILL